MKKVIFYTDTPIYGGAERHMFLLAKSLDITKFQVIVVCSDFKQLNPWCDKFLQHDIRVLRLKVSHKHDPRHLFQFRKILEKENPDLLHLHLWNPGSCRYAFMAADPKKLKIVTTEHDPFPLHGLKKTLKKSSLKKTARVIAVSKANQDLLLKLYPEMKDKITVVPNGIDLESFERETIHFSSQEKNRTRNNLFLSGTNDFVIISIAALHPRKGLKHLIASMKEVTAMHPRTRLVIVGEGPEQNNLQRIIKKLHLENNAILIGHQENISKLLKSSDLFVLPSIKEAFGLVLLEAMAANLPIIASNVGGIPEIIHNHKNGELVKPESSKELSAKIIELIENRALAQKLAFVAHHDVKNFTAKIMAEKTEEVYNMVLTE